VTQLSNTPAEKLQQNPQQNPLNHHSETAYSPNSSKPQIVVLAGVIGNVIEWYDFALFGYFAPLISTLFFPNENPLISLLETYGVFAAGFVMRPIGAAIFGYIGDRIGRRTELFLSVILMAIPTFAVGLLPDYGRIGLAAPILLISLRLIQGLSVGGEFTGSVTYVAETAPQHRRGFIASFANVGSMSGMLLGLAIVTALTQLLPEASLQTWGWRLPFLLGGILGLVGLYIRRNIPVSQIFQDHKQEQPLPLLQGLRQNLGPMVQTTLYAGSYSVVFYLPLVYLPTYLDQFTEVPLSTALVINTVATALLLAVIPLMGWLSDWALRRRTLLMIAMVSLALSSYPAFVLLNQGNLLWIWIAQLELGALIGILVGVSPAMLVELFPTEVRLTAYSLSFNLGGCIIGGTSPLVSTWIIETTGNIYAPAFYLLGCAVLATIALGFMHDRSREPLL
jgi:MHS family proline/betaine transporter-like MFS transporter